MYVECIKGFVVSGFLVMQGEVFKLINREEMIFEGVEGASLCPGMEIDFQQDQLANNFKLIVGR
jgi:hypothetical protein